MKNLNIANRVFYSAQTNHYLKHKDLCFKKEIVVAVLTALCIPCAFSADSWTKEYVITEDVGWEKIIRGGGMGIQAGQKVTIENEATVTFDFVNNMTIFGSQAMIYGVDMEQPIQPGVYFTAPVLVIGGKLHGIAGESSTTSIGIWNYSNYEADITVQNTSIEMENYDTGIRIYNGKLTVDNSEQKYTLIKNGTYGIWTNNEGAIVFKGGQLTIDTTDYAVLTYGNSQISTTNTDIKFINAKDYGFFIKDDSVLNLNGDELSIIGSNVAVNAKGNADLTINHALLKIDQVGCGFNLFENSKIHLQGRNFEVNNAQFAISAAEQTYIGLDYETIDSSNSEVFSAVDNNATVNVQAKNLTALSSIIAGASGSGKIMLTATNTSDINGTLVADANSQVALDNPATISLTLGGTSEDAQTIRSNQFNYSGDAISVNKGVINLTFGKGTQWVGRADDFKDADSEDWRQAHKGEFGDVVNNLLSSGQINVSMSEGAYWNVTGQSWVSKLDGQGTVDLRGSDTGGYALHIGEITGSNTFLVNLDKDNKAQSDMIYVYNGSGADEQNVVISNRDEVLSSMEVGDRVRFATVANASGSFVSEGMDTEVKGDGVKTFGKSTQIRDAGVKNVNFKVVYEPYHSDQSSEADNLGYNGGEEFNDVKPGNDYVEAIYSEGENPYNVYIERAEDIADVSDPDDPSQNVTDAGRTIIDMSRANYANAVQMDTLNKRQGEMRYSQGREDGLWVRIRHDDIGKKSSFRLDNTMIEVGLDSRYVKDNGEFHTGVALDYMNGDTDYHHISGSGDLDRYGAWMYLTWLGNEGDYSDLVLKFGHLESDFKIWAPTTGERIRGDYDNDVFLVSYEQGKKFQNEEKWFIEPQAQLQYAYVTSDEYQTSQGTEVRLDGIHSLIGRVGLRIGKDVTRDNPLTFYARGDVMHEFMGDQDIKAKDNTGAMRIRYDNDDTWYSAGAGMTYVQDKNTVMYFEAEKVFGASNTSSYIISGGARFLFN